MLVELIEKIGGVIKIPFTANFETTYADLTRLLLIGKGGAAVSRYMGGVLTNNVSGSNLPSK